ncbi:MAG: LytR/AlgR family response regulator transcription factor [Flavobacteriales bacterium]
MSGALRILIVEDEAVIAQHLRKLLEIIGYEVVGRATGYTRALELLVAEKPDLVLLDIVLNGSKDGVDVAHLIRASYPDIPYIFLTSHADPKTVERATAAKPYGYLVKPFEREDVFTAIEVAMANVRQAKQEVASANAASAAIFVKDKDVFCKVQLAEICYLQADGNYVDLVTKTATHVVRTTLKEFLDGLPSEDFLRIHKSYAINVKMVSEIGKKEVVVNDVEIPITKTQRTQLLENLKITG